MSALAMVLAAGVVMGDGSGKVSGEIERGLNLSGEWEGTYGAKGCEAVQVRLKGGVLTVERGNKRGPPIPIQFTDEGHGKFRFTLGGRPTWTPGRYTVGEGSVVLTFWAGPKRDQQVVFALSRVKPAK